jgi:hypothetical protein
LEDTKGIFGSSKSKKDRQQMAKRKENVNLRTDNTMAKKKRKKVQNTTQKIKDRAIRTSLKSGDELRCSGRVSNSCSTCDNSSVTVIYAIPIFNMIAIYMHS